MLRTLLYSFFTFFFIPSFLPFLFLLYFLHYFFFIPSLLPPSFLPYILLCSFYTRFFLSLLSSLLLPFFLPSLLHSFLPYFLPHSLFTFFFIPSVLLSLLSALFLPYFLFYCFFTSLVRFIYFLFFVFFLWYIYTHYGINTLNLVHIHSIIYTYNKKNNKIGINRYTHPVREKRKREGQTDREKKERKRDWKKFKYPKFVVDHVRIFYHSSKMLSNTSCLPLTGPDPFLPEHPSKYLDRLICPLCYFFAVINIEKSWNMKWF